MRQRRDPIDRDPWTQMLSLRQKADCNRVRVRVRVQLWNLPRPKAPGGDVGGAVAALRLQGGGIQRRSPRGNQELHRRDKGSRLGREGSSSDRWYMKNKKSSINNYNCSSSSPSSAPSCSSAVARVFLASLRSRGQGRVPRERHEHTHRHKRTPRPRRRHRLRGKHSCYCLQLCLHLRLRRQLHRSRGRECDLCWHLSRHSHCPCRQRMCSRCHCRLCRNSRCHCHVGWGSNHC